MATTIRGLSAGDIAVRQLRLGLVQLARSTGQLGTGLRVRSAADDAAGLAISTRMSARLRGVHEAIKHLQDGISLMNIADGTLGEATGIVQRMRELVVQARGAALSGEQRRAIGAELHQLRRSLDNALDNAQFNRLPLFKGIAPPATPDQGKMEWVGGGIGTGIGVVPSGTGPGIDIAQVDVTFSSSQITEWLATASGSQLILTASDGSRSQTVSVGAMTSAETSVQILHFNQLGVDITLSGWEAGTAGSGATIAANLEGLSNIQTGQAAPGTLGGVSAFSRFIINPDSHGFIDVFIRRTQTATLGGGDGYWISDLITDENAVSTLAKTTKLMPVLDVALQQLTDVRASAGGDTNKMESYLRDLFSQQEQLETSRSRIVDADMAQQSAEQVRNTTLQDLRTAVTREAVRLNEVALSLIQQGQVPA